MTALQLFDALPAHIEDALRASIRRFGVIVPVVRDQDGRTIDGHHRVRIAGELGVAYPERHVTVADDDEAREIARTLNSDRRHLSEEQRREIVAELRQAGHSYRAIGGALGVSEPTIRRDVQRAEIASGDAIQPERINRQGGGSYPATRPTAPKPEPTLEPEPGPDVIDPGDEPRPDFGIGEFWDEPADEPPLPDGQDRADQAAREADQRAAAPEWPPEETELRDRMESGETVVVNLRGQHRNLIDWAEQRGLYVRIDRRTEWGNPFHLNADGDRDTVIANYATHYLPHKPSLLGKLPTLRGKALGCWCAPEPCHGDALKREAEQ